MLVSAFLLEHWGHFQPCIFCVYERWPYIVAIFISLLALSVAKPSLSSLWSWLLLINFGIEGLISAYHIAIEHHWVPLPSMCEVFTPLGVTLEELKDTLLHTNLVRCDEPSLRIFGFSLVEYNFIFALGLCLLSCIFLNLNSRKKGCKL
jgi:disulfide bond formation protein DsbB